MTTRIKLRRDTAANWAAANPVLALGEAGHDTTNNQLRIGDGTSHWSELEAIGGASTSGNILLSEDEGSQLTLNNNGFLLGGDDGYDDIRIGQDPDNEAQRAHIYISQDNPYIRSEVLSSTSNNYRNEMLWHNPWYSRYNKLITNAYGVHIQNAQWNGPGTSYFNRFSFTKDGVFNMPPAGVIRSNDFQSSYWNAPDFGTINNDSSVNPGTDSSLTFDANTISIARGSLNMNGVSTLPLNNDGNGYWIAMTGEFGEGEGNDIAFEGSCMDDAGNVYTLEIVNPGGIVGTAVTKWSTTGERLWQRLLFEDDSTGNPTTNVQPVGIGFYSGLLTIALNDYMGSLDQPLFMYVNTDGTMSDPGFTFVSPTVDIEINDSAIDPDTGGFAAVGRAATGKTYITPSFIQVAANTVQSGQRLVVSRDNTFNPPGQWSLFPTPDTQNQFFMFGSGITGNVAINAVNTVDGLAATRVSGSGTGTNALFTATWNTGSYVVSATTAGSNYDNTDQLKILGSALGGISPTNDITFGITTDAGAITGITSPTGTANTAVTVLGLTGNPVDFSAIPTPTILVNTSTDALFITAFVYGPGPTYNTFGNVGWDTFNAIAFDTINTNNDWSGNLYVGGRYHPTGNNNPRRSVLAKMVQGEGPYIEWQVEVDDYTGRNEVRGIAVDGDGNVYTVAENNNANTTVTKVDSEGEMQWQRIINNTTFSPTYDHTTYGIGVNSQNDVIVTGLAVRGDDFDGDNEDITIVAFSSNGDMIWARTLGTLQDEFSQYDRTFDNITVKDDTMIITGKTYAGGYQSTHPGESVGFVAKLPADGTGVGHYGEWRYLETAVEIETVSNTAANVATMTFTNNDIDTVSNVYAYANIAVRSSGASPEFQFPSITYQLGGPGRISGLNQLRFTNGATITNVSEEGLMLWQPDPTAAQLAAGLHNAEYIAMGYGGTDAENANVLISAGTYNWGTDDGDLDGIYYPDNGADQSQRQVNIDIVGRSGGDEYNTNHSNWHFDEDGSMYLPAQGHYYYGGVTFDDSADLGNGLTTYYFSLAEYPKLADDLQEGDKAFSPGDDSNWTPVYERGIINSANCYVTMSSTFDPSTSSIGFTNYRRSGIVYADGSKQLAGGSKFIPGYGGPASQGKTYSYTNSSTERLIWTSSNSNVNAFRGTFRCQLGDPSSAIKIYDITGSYYTIDGGETNYTATSLLDNYSTYYNPVVFNLTREADGHLRLYATPPVGFDGTVFITSDVTEFGYTTD